MHVVLARNLGFPRMGSRRELKFALESYWSGKSGEAELLQTAQKLRRQHWQLQAKAGIALPPSNDFSLYDHVLDMVAMLGAVPSRFRSAENQVSLTTYFAMARGAQHTPALEMTKWFDTNYHYVVPEFEPGHQYALRSTKAVDEYREAKALGIETRPVLVGPVSFVLLGKPTNSSVTRPIVLQQILPLYADLLKRLAAAGAKWVQMDEPCLCLDLDASAQRMYREAYAELVDRTALPQLMLTSYFGSLGENLELALELKTAGLHVDLVRAPEQLDAVLAKIPAETVLSLGLVDGRNVWRTELQRALMLAKKTVSAHSRERVEIAPSCSLLHAPVDLGQESKLDGEVKSWMAFARQKLEEVAVLARALEEPAAVATELAANAAAIAARRSSPRMHRKDVAARLAAVEAEMLHRQHAYAQRRVEQRKRLALPLLPTTTIGSYPQTDEVRRMRAEYRKGKVDQAAYERFIEKEIARCIQEQEEIGLDVLVHGEAERNDMVEYFGEQLDGFVFSENGWVQSYGSRCVKPPILFGDVARPRPMTVRWATYAQSLTRKPVKGMLTGPVTILQWSFVRDDQPRAESCRQIALAMRDEVEDLERAGIGVIQIDEPAIREGLPLRRADWPEYLHWSVDAFRLASSGVADRTQIHSHMCYSEFNDILDAIARMDADVISIECSRSRMELLDGFQRVRYPNEIGPGVYDIHSPRVPSEEEIETLLRRALAVLTPEQLWVNPDCGLKTRGWTEVRAALKNMVATARRVRASASVAQA